MKVYNVLLTAPLNVVGEISARYIGASPAFRPELIPMTNRPAINIWKLPAVWANPISRVATKTKTLFNRRPPFLPNLLEMKPTMEPPIMPPTQKMETIHDQMSVASVLQVSTASSV